MKVRQDAWSHEDDLLLAETVLRHIRDGSTQVAAFDEVGDQLNRTSAACGYRWNAEVRSQYEKAVEIAKKQRKEKKRAAQSNVNKQEQVLQAHPSIGQQQQQKQPILGNEREITSKYESKSSITLDECISFLRNYHSEDNPEIKKENNCLNKENQELLKKNEELSLKYEQLMKSKHRIEKDYKLLMSVLNQARNMSDESIADKKYYN
ncbi:MAG: RsfA family transcriptional regulator [Bacillota bacterium]